MKLILAIDIKNGKVVKAYAGFRLNYKPLVLDKKDFSCPFTLIKKAYRDLKINNIYLADLDAIEKKPSNKFVIYSLMKLFPKINFFLDLGFDYPSKIYRLINSFRKNKIKNYYLVVGTETMKNYSIENFIIENKIFFSIDFNGYEKNWIKKMYRKKNLNIILMFIKRTGGRGVDYVTIKKVNKLLKQHNCIVAGGIKHLRDFKRLSTLGITGAISSNYIHKVIARDKLIAPSNLATLEK
jgi:phosphoribosylformimino-5-aminoimidazole carboxamide ribotide isomerase